MRPAAKVLGLVLVARGTRDIMRSASRFQYRGWRSGLVPTGHTPSKGATGPCLVAPEQARPGWNKANSQEDP